VAAGADHGDALMAVLVNGDAAALAAEGVAGRSAFVRYRLDGPPPRVRRVSGRDADGGVRITVIIPTADGRRGGNLNRLLAQLTRQTYQRIEVIVVAGDRRQGRAINTGAALARGDILVTMDDDTRIGHDDLLRRIVDAFDADASIGMAGVSNLVPADVPWIVRRAMRELPRRTSQTVAVVTDSDMVEHPCLAVRRDVFRQVGGEHEWIPRGLDPYLRAEVRASGYRVVVLPHAWIHHLLPGTLRGILAQYFRNGAGAAYVAKFYPEFVIDQALQHGHPVPATDAPQRASRYVGRTAGALATLRWIYAATLLAYGAGYAWGMRTLQKDSL